MNTMDCLFLPPDCGPELSAGLRVYHLPAGSEGARMSLEDCAEAVQGRAVALVLPAEVCSALAVALPTQKARWLRQALPYAVEELLAEDVDQLHLALGERLSDGRYRVIALRRSLLAGWLAQLEAQGLKVGAVHVDADLLPRDGTQVLVLGDRALVGGVSEARLAVAAEDWPMLADQLPLPFHLYGETEEPPLEVGEYRRVIEPYRFLADGRSLAVDLAQAEFAVRQEGGSLEQWKPLLAVAGLWLVLQVGFNLAQAWYLERQGDAYSAESQALYRELFPEDTRIVNLRAQFAEHLAQGAASGSGQFLHLLDQVAGPLQAPNLTLIQLDYSENRGDLALQVRASDFAELEQLRQRLSEAGLAVQMGSASREEGGVTARVVIGS